MAPEEPAFATRTISSTESGAGTVIGPYHLLQRIGEGGMGEVWLAEQKQPVRRRVAIKLIKVGMDTREVVARFESERQALALMDHPAIAKVFDAGSTPEGRPYFVMEYVAGIPTDYCDKHKLSTRQRLELSSWFAKACSTLTRKPSSIAI
jgi:serine/threonine protein kinase